MYQVRLEQAKEVKQSFELVHFCWEINWITFSAHDNITGKLPSPIKLI